MSAQIRKKNDRSKLVDQDYSRRMYAMEGESYLTVMRQVTQKYLDSVMLVKQSAWKKPYRENNYGTMEYKGDPGIPPVPVVGPGTADCTPKGEAVGGGSHLCEDGISCGQWIFTCAHRIISFEVVQDFGWIQSIVYGTNDTVTVTVCWNEIDRDAGRKIGPKGILAKGKEVVSTFDFGTCCPTTKACNGKCEGCPPPTIGYTSQQMSCGGTQTLTHSGGGAGGKYTWSADYGTFSVPTGTSVVYTAPATNAGCASNPTITITDCCKHTATLKIANSCVIAGGAGYLSCCVPGRSGGICRWIRGKNIFNCDGSYPSGSTYCDIQCGEEEQVPCTIDEYYAWLVSGCTAAIAHCNANCSDGCAEGYHDTRTAAQKTAGCCPAQLLP